MCTSSGEPSCCATSSSGPTGGRAARYAAVRQSLGEPDPFRLHYREAIRGLVAEIIRGPMDTMAANARIGVWAEEHVDETDRERFRAGRGAGTPEPSRRQLLAIPRQAVRIRQLAGDLARIVAARPAAGALRRCRSSRQSARDSGFGEPHSFLILAEVHHRHFRSDGEDRAQEVAGQWKLMAIRPPDPGETRFSGAGPAGCPVAECTGIPGYRWCRRCRDRKACPQPCSRCHRPPGRTGRSDGLPGRQTTASPPARPRHDRHCRRALRPAGRDVASLPRPGPPRFGDRSMHDETARRLAAALADDSHEFGNFFITRMLGPRDQLPGRNLPDPLSCRTAAAQPAGELPRRHAWRPSWMSPWAT